MDPYDFWINSKCKIFYFIQFISFSFLVQGFNLTYNPNVLGLS
jgi:hypothetical protein